MGDWKVVEKRRGEPKFYLTLPQKVSKLPALNWSLLRFSDSQRLMFEFAVRISRLSELHEPPSFLFY